MKLVYWSENRRYHCVHQKKDSPNFRSNCHASEDEVGNGSDFIYKKNNIHTPLLPTKDSICTKCYKAADKKEMTFYLVKVKLGIE